MALQRGIRHPAARDFLELLPSAPDRLDFETVPRAATVASYILTRAAAHSWAEINRHLSEPGGALFWIGGAAGSGKTHFLNYVIALAERAGSLSVEPARHLVCGLELAGQVRNAELEAYLIDVLAERIGGDQQSLLMWREMPRAEALKLALEAARRTGIRAITIAIDFSMSEPEAPLPCFDALGQLADSFQNVKLTVLAAGRGSPPRSARVLEVAPGDPDEQIAVAIQRARLIDEHVRDSLGELYQGVDTGGSAPETIYPFHPACIGAIRAIAGASPAIASISRIVRDALARTHELGQSERLIFPADLFAADSLGAAIENRLGASGRAALKIVREALAGLGSHDHELGEQIVDTLALHSIEEPGTSLSLDDLYGRLPMLSGEGSSGSSSQLMLQILGLIAKASGGVIVLDSGAARFDLAAAGAPEVARFNAMIVLVRRFDPSLAPAKDASELAGKLARLRDAMTNAVESASHTRDALTGALREANLALPAEQERAIADYIGLAERGTDAIIEAAADPRALAALTAALSAYEPLAAAASAIPKMRAMREYLAETELRVPSDEDSSNDRRLVALETECQLLGVELGPRVLLGAARNLDALDARFHKFRWTYVQQYRTAHEEWRAEMDKLARLASEASRYLAALKRLNAISALGPPAGEELEERVEKACAGIRRCELEGPLRTEVTPRCPACDYALGEESPAAELSELIDRLKRALEVKLAALSQTAIARIIRDNDRAHRLDGFLKITQASQTDALVRVLDDQLARYLARMLDENLSTPGSSSRAVVRHLDRDRPKPRR